MGNQLLCFPNHTHEDVFGLRPRDDSLKKNYPSKKPLVEPSIFFLRVEINLLSRARTGWGGQISFNHFLGACGFVFFVVCLRAWQLSIPIEDTIGRSVSLRLYFAVRSASWSLASNKRASEWKWWWRISSRSVSTNAFRRPPHSTQMNWPCRKSTASTNAHGNTCQWTRL